MFRNTLRSSLVLFTISLLLPAVASAKTQSLNKKDEAAIMKQVRLDAKRINRPNMLPSGSKITPDSRKHLHPGTPTSATFAVKKGSKLLCDGTCSLLKQGSRVVAANAVISWHLLWPVPASVLK